MIIAMAIFMGGFAMFTAGLMEWKKGNTYGMAAYASYGLFWFSFAALTLLPRPRDSQKVPVVPVQWLRILLSGGSSPSSCLSDH